MTDYGRFAALESQLKAEELAEQESARADDEARQKANETADPFGYEFTKRLGKQAIGPLKSILPLINNPEYPTADYGTRLSIMLNVNPTWGNSLFEPGKVNYLLAEKVR